MGTSANLWRFEREVGLLVQMYDAVVRWKIGLVFPYARLSISMTHTHTHTLISIESKELIMLSIASTLSLRI
jgi:hypothetical protein